MEATTIGHGCFVYRTFTTTNVSEYVIDFIEIDIEDYLKKSTYHQQMFVNFGHMYYTCKPEDALVWLLEELNAFLFWTHERALDACFDFNNPLYRFLKVHNYYSIHL